MSIEWIPVNAPLPPLSDKLYCGFDTETTGLDIIKDRLFLLIFGIYDSETNRGYIHLV